MIRSKLLQFCFRVASVPVREQVFVLTDANARTRKRGGGGEIDSKALGAYGRDVLNEDGKLLLRFAEDNKLALLNTFFCTPKGGASYKFQSANRGKVRARLDYVRNSWTADCSSALMSDRLLWSQPNRTVILYTQQSGSQQGPHQTGGKREHQGDLEDGRPTAVDG